MGKNKYKKYPNQRPIRPTFTAPPPPAVNTAYGDAAIVATNEFKSLQIIIAGLGGTGAYVAEHVGRLAKIISRDEVDVRLMLVDPDIVKEENLDRQLFWQYELGEPKAVACARRFGRDWGNKTIAVVEEYGTHLLLGADMTLVIGCVDNPGARVNIAETLRLNKFGELPRAWWLDCGNLRDTGRVLLGSAYHVEQMRGAFSVNKKLCVQLPSPALQYPSLLIPEKGEKPEQEMSCAQMAAANLQSLNINPAIAVQAADMMTRLFITKDLKRFACGVNVASGSVKSSYVRPEDVARSIDRPTSFVLHAPMEDEEAA